MPNNVVNPFMSFMPLRKVGHKLVYMDQHSNIETFTGSETVNEVFFSLAGLG